MPDPHAPDPLNIQEHLSKFDEFFKVIQQSKAFTELLLIENQKLRTKISELEEKMSASGHADFETLEKEHFELINRYQDIQTQNDKLLTMYVATHQLHSTLNPVEVHQGLREILTNIIGADTFFIVLRELGQDQFYVTTREGEALYALGHIAEPDEILAKVLSSGNHYFYQAESLDPKKYVACISLKVKDDIYGAIGIQRLLHQKHELLTPADLEILNLLADHAASSLVTSNLFHKTERKLKTVEGFMDLLNKEQRKNV